MVFPIRVLDSCVNARGFIITNLVALEKVHLTEIVQCSANCNKMHLIGFSSAACVTNIIMFITGQVLVLALAPRSDYSSLMDG